MNKFIVVGFLSLAIIGLSNAERAVAAEEAGEVCSQPRNPTDIVRCALSRSPQAKAGEIVRNSQSHLVNTARQRLNPEISAEVIPNGNGGQRAEVALLHTFELGGKRSARIEAAEAASDFAIAQLNLSLADLAVDTVKDLYLLRQKTEEEKLLKESAETFSTILRAYKRRMGLSPGQEVALSVFEIAAEESALRMSRIILERQAILASLSTRVGLSGKSIDDRLLPQLKSSWPAPAQSNGSRSLALEVLKASSRQAEAEVRLAHAQSWPDMALGPKVEFENTNGTNDTRVGIALSLPLPVFHRNSAGRAYSSANLERIRLETQLAQNIVANDREKWLRTYEAAGAAIKRSLENAKLQQRHKTLHRLIGQGLVGATEVIELHRQIFDYQEALHEQELQGVEAQWRLLALDGKLLEGEVK